MKNFFRDPRNLHYRLNIIIPVLVFLTSLLSGLVLSGSKTSYIALLGISLFGAVCSLAVAMAMTKPLEDVITRAVRLVQFQGRKADKGQMIEVYQLIEKLIQMVKNKEEHHETAINSDLPEGIEKLDYLLPLGYMSLMVAHEVRNPLSTIVGMNELLRVRLEDPKLREYVRVSMDAAKKIDIFTKELLDFTDNQVVREDVDINSLLQDICRNLQMQFRDIACELKGGDVSGYQGDKNKIYQALFNITRNAFEHEKEGGYVEIVTGREDGSIFIAIHNRGSIIGSEDLQTLFKPFFTKKKGGRGLGLFVSRRVARLHGGDIKVESNEKGTTFIVNLPVKNTNE